MSKQNIAPRYLRRLEPGTVVRFTVKWSRSVEKNLGNVEGFDAVASIVPGSRCYGVVGRGSIFTAFDTAAGEVCLLVPFGAVSHFRLYPGKLYDGGIFEEDEE